MCSKTKEVNDFFLLNQFNHEAKKSDLNSMTVEQLLKLKISCRDYGDKQSMKLIEWKFDTAASTGPLYD